MQISSNPIGAIPPKQEGSIPVKDCGSPPAISLDQPLPVNDIIEFQSCNAANQPPVQGPQPNPDAQSRHETAILTGSGADQPGAASISLGRALDVKG